MMALLQELIVISNIISLKGIRNVEEERKKMVEKVRSSFICNSLSETEALPKPFQLILYYFFFLTFPFNLFLGFYLICSYR